MCVYVVLQRKLRENKTSILMNERNTTTVVFIEIPKRLRSVMEKNQAEE